MHLLKTKAMSNEPTSSVITLCGLYTTADKTTKDRHQVECKLCLNRLSKK